MESKEKKVLTIDPKEIKEGACHLYPSPFVGGGKVAVCKEDGKIKIFEVLEDKTEE